MYDWNIYRKNMLEGQIVPNSKFDPKLLSAVASVPRESFVSEELQTIAYSDANLYFADDSFMMSPFKQLKMIDACEIKENRITSYNVCYTKLLRSPFKQLKMIDACEIKENDIVLNIGGGCGYASALMSNLAHMVFCLENDKICDEKINNLMISMSIFNVVTFAAENDKDIAKHAPYDVILLNGAVNKVPDSLCSMLANNGKIVAVVAPSGDELEQQKGKLIRITRDGERFDNEVLADMQIPDMRNVAGVGKMFF